jgi:hypothetical protein
MSDCSIRITVRFRAEGFHHWPDAPERRFYLRATHRHFFHVELSTPVAHIEREIEFHDLLEEAKRRFGGPRHGSDSCETMAINLAKAMSEHYGGRPFTVSVFEDGEAGATVTLS